jgi:hypothetical protein
MTTFTTEDLKAAQLVAEAPFHPGYEDAVPRAVPKDTLQQVETKAILEIFEAMKALEIQLAIANSRIRDLESQIYGGSVK